MLDQDYYKPMYKTASARVLYLIAKKGYGTVTAMADDLGKRKQWISQMFKKPIPIEVAGYLGRKFGVHPALLAYEAYATLFGGEIGCQNFVALLNKEMFFDPQDKQYILAGSHIKNAATFARISDKNI